MELKTSLDIGEFDWVFCTFFSKEHPLSKLISMRQIFLAYKNAKISLR